MINERKKCGVNLRTILVSLCDCVWKNVINRVCYREMFHYHNPFQRRYQKYRQDVEEDKNYIVRRRKMGL